MVITTVITQV